MQTNSAIPISGSVQQASNQSTEGLSSSAGKTINQGIPHSQMVPIPMASSSGGTDYADYKDFYKYQQQQQKTIVQTNNSSQMQTNSQAAVSNDQNFQHSQNLHQQTTPLREKEYANQSNINNKQFNNQYEMGGNPHFQKNDENMLQNQNQNEQHQQILQQSSNIPSQDMANIAINQTHFQRNQFQNNEQQNYDNNQQNRQQFQQNQQQPNLNQQVNQKQNGQIVSTPLQQKHIIPQQQQQQQEEVEEENLVGVIKIKDGLFICDEYGAQDLEFIISNKVSKIVNTAGMQLNNHWDNIGVQYLTLNWQDDEKQVLFDEAEKIPDEIFNFMNDGLENHESVLIKSEKAQNRACFVICAFIMRKYRWSMLKTLEFINSRRQDLEMRPAFLKQLQMYENKLFKRGLGPKTQRWTEIFEVNDPVKNEELILRNTYLNSQQGPWAEFSKMPASNPLNLEQADLKQASLSNPKVLKWRDEINAPFSSINPQQIQGSNNKQNAGPLSFMCGSAPQILGASLKTNNPQSSNGTQKLAICFEYSKENDLLQQVQTQKQQNHIIFNKDSIQMKRNVTPILRKKMKPVQPNLQSLSASKNIMQVPISGQAQVSTINNSQGNKENVLTNISQVNGQNNVMNQQNKSIQNIGKNNDNQQRIPQQEQFRGQNNDAIQYMGQINQKQDENIQNVRASIQLNDSQAQQFNNFNLNHPNFGGQFGKISGSISGQQPQINNFVNPPNNPHSQAVNSDQYLQQQQTQVNKEQKNGHKLAQVQEIQTGPTPVQQRSSSTRIKPNSASQSQSQSTSTSQNAVKSSQRITSSLQGREEPNSSSNQQQANSSSAQRLAKLTSQNISQPRRREPTSRVAPKNQVSSNSQGQMIGQNNTNIDTSILSTSMNNGNSINNGNSQNQNISSGQKTSQARLNSNRQSQQQPNSNSAIGGSQVSASIPSGQAAQSANNQPIHPSKKQQLRYQQQLNGRGYSPSYNNLIKDQNGQPYQQQPNSKNSTQNAQQIQQNKSSKPYGNSTASQNQAIVGHSGSSHTPTHVNGATTSSQKKQVNNTSQHSSMGQHRPGSAPKQIQVQQQHHHNTSSITNAQSNPQLGIPSPNQSNNNYARNTQQQMAQTNKNNSQTGSISHTQNNQSLSSQSNVRASMQQQQLKQQTNGYMAGSISSQGNNGQAFQQKQNQAPSSSHHMIHTSATIGQINSQPSATHQQANTQAVRGNSGVRVAPSTTHHQLLSNNNSMVIRNSNSLSSIQQKTLQQQNHNAQPSPKNINNEAQNISQLDLNQYQYSNQGTSNGQQNASKSILSSFRNGPIKILGANSSTSQLGISFSEGQSKQMQHMQQFNNAGNNMINSINQNQVHQHQIQNSSAFNRIGMNQQPQNMSQTDGRIDQQNNLQFRQAKSSQMVSSGSDNIPGMIGQSQSQMNPALRPASAPSNKRPPSPGQLATQNQASSIQQNQQNQPINTQTAHNQMQNQQAYYQQEQNISQQQNRVKYPKQLIGENQINNSGYAMKQMQGLQTNNGGQMSNTISQSGNHKLIAQNNTYQVNRPSSSNSAIGSSRGIVSASIQQQQLIQQQQAHHQGPHLSAQQPGIGNGNHNATSYIQQQSNVFLNNGSQQNANQIKTSQQARMFQQPPQNAYIHQAPHHFGPQIQQIPVSPGGGLQGQNVGYNIHSSKTQNQINANSAFQNKH